MAAPRRCPVMWDIIEEHLEEAAFLANQWQRACHSPAYCLQEVAQGPEARLMAHLDGLACAGPEARERLLMPWLERDRPEEVFVAALALLATGAPLDWLLPFFVDGSGPRGVAIFRALSLARHEGVPGFLRSRELQARPHLLAEAIHVLSLREALEPDTLLPLLRSESPEIRAAALTAVRDDTPAVRTLLESALGSGSPGLRLAAGETALILGIPAGLQALRKPVEHTAPEAARTLAALAAAGQSEDVARMATALGVPALETAALWALGHSGWRHAVELCLEPMRHDRTARLAGEAFSRVTGLRIEGAFARPAEADEENGLPPFEEDDLDADLVPPPEATLPFPDAAAVARWWMKEKDLFSPKARYLPAQPLSTEVAWKALATEPMRGRGQLALDLAVQTQGAVRFDTRTWTRRQAEVLATGLASARPGRQRFTAR